MVNHPMTVNLGFHTVVNSIPPEADRETRIPVKIFYLEGNPRKLLKSEKERILPIKCALLTQLQLWVTGASPHGEFWETM